VASVAYVGVVAPLERAAISLGPVELLEQLHSPPVLGGRQPPGGRMRLLGRVRLLTRGALALLGVAHFCQAVAADNVS
jgi:hypothetical protein